MSRNRASLGGLVLILILGFLGAGLWHWVAQESAPEWTSDREVLRIGYAIEAPYAMIGTDGLPEGAVPLIAAELAKRVGARRVEWRLSEFGQLIDELDSGTVDVIAAGLFVTPEREMKVAFSSVVFEVGPGLLVRAGNPRGITDYSALARTPGVIATALSGAVEIEHLREAGVPLEAILPVPDAWSGRSLVGAGRADALALSAPSVRWLARTGGDKEGETGFEAVSFSATHARDVGRVAFAFRRQDRALLAAWNQAQAEFMTSQSYREIAERHGFAPLAAAGTGGRP